MGLNSDGVLRLRRKGGKQRQEGFVRRKVGEQVQRSAEMNRPCRCGCRLFV